MNKLYFLCGIPGSSKSTWAENNKEKLNAIIHSSDEIREELLNNVNDQSQNELVFKTLHSRVKEDLLNGKNVIMDQTGLNRKRRIHFLSNELKDIPCEKICVLFATPVDVCKRNNANRERKVPEAVIEKMIRNFEVPCIQEGWNKVQIVWWDWQSDGMKFDFHEDVEKWRSISHDNLHHSLSIGDHMNKAWEYACENTDDFLLQMAAYLHDCGKVFTKAFINSKGEQTNTVAHFYEHHNVSAYESLFYLKDLFTEGCKLNDEEILYVSLLINMHMRPFLAYRNSDKARERDRKLFGDVFMKDLEFLHKCDLAAH